MGKIKLYQTTLWPERSWTRWVRLAVYLFCVAAFVIDVTHDDTLAFGVLYIPLVATAVFHRNPMAVWWLAAIASAMVIAGFVIPGGNPDFAGSLANRGLSIIAILVTAHLIRHERFIRDQLAQQTSRAESADRSKTEVFNNLSHELRTPLAAILGFADLLVAKARPDQLEQLGHIQNGGRRLLATLDNLIDLTQIHDRTVRARSLDLTGVLTQALEANRPYAQDKQITLTLNMPNESMPRVMADGWALRRIVDNLIANGIKFTDPGGAVEITARPAGDGGLVTVHDTGKGMPPSVLEQLGSPFYQADSGPSRRFEGMGAGLALSMRLAEAMGAALHFDSTPGHGTTALLSLRRA